MVNKNLVLIQGYNLDDTSWDEIRAKLPSGQFDIKTYKRIGRDLTGPASLTDIATLICKDIPKRSISKDFLPRDGSIN